MAELKSERQVKKPVVGEQVLIKGEWYPITQVGRWGQVLGVKFSEAINRQVVRDSDEMDHAETWTVRSAGKGGA